MPTLRGSIRFLRIYTEEGRQDWALTFSKLCWFGACILFPFSLFRFLHQGYGLVTAFSGVLVLGVFMRLLGPSNLVMLDELLNRISPTFRAAVRFGVTQVYDFRLLTPENREVACILKGDLMGAGIRQGDFITLHGHYNHGTFWVRSGVIEGTGSIFLPRSQHTWVLALATAGALALLILFLTGVLDEVLFSCLQSFLTSETEIEGYSSN
jgi:hypothetical protein